MKADERYNEIINTVEKMINEDTFPTTRDIADTIAKQNGIEYRAFNTLFQFLTGYSFMEYIRNRKMNLAYTALIEEDSFILDRALCITGYNDENSFSKAFRKCYDTTPKTAYEQKDRSLIKDPLFWEQLSTSNHQLEPVKIEEDNPMGSTYLGIPKNEIQFVIRARELQLLYDFNNEQTDAAYRVAKQYSLPLEKAFDFVEAYCIYWEYGAGGLWHSFEEEDKDLVVNNDDLVYANCTLGLSISEALTIMDEIKSTKYSIKDINMEILDLAKRAPEIPYGDIIACYQEADEQTDMSLVLMALEDGLTPEEAVARAQQEMEELMDSTYDAVPDEINAFLDWRYEGEMRYQENDSEDIYFDKDWDDIPNDDKYGY